MKWTLVAVALLSLSAGATRAEEAAPLLCKDAVTETEMIECAHNEFEIEDKKLNAQWAETKKAVSEWDAAIEDEESRGAIKALLKSQRAWIDYRDGHCDADGYSVYGGTMRPSVIELCLADLTRKRTAELKDLIDGFQ
ncbi:MAG: hypothetical protein RLZZ444_1757 [Pseudomonadota bacterium]|jgi:uncharacterized protein YecT (DUF1311 family)